MKQRQGGFTLVEIAIVLVIIGLLLGGVLKGQELISSARVRNLAEQQSGIQAAYYGFQDRYRAVPGDMDKDKADDAIDADINTGGDANGKIDPTWDEVNAVWEHLSKSGFIKGSYDGASTTSTADTSPINVFNGILVLVRDDSYEDKSTSTLPTRLLLFLGRNVPADIARELDVKLDDGGPLTGSLRNADTSGAFDGLGSSESGCTADATSGSEKIWDIDTNVQDCNPVYLF